MNIIDLDAERARRRRRGILDATVTASGGFTPGDFARAIEAISRPPEPHTHLVSSTQLREYGDGSRDHMWCMECGMPFTLSQNGVPLPYAGRAL